MSERLHRRVAGWHDIRLDGLTDLLLRAPGASVLDNGHNGIGVIWQEAPCW